MCADNIDEVIRQLDAVTLNNSIYDLEIPENIKEAYDMNPVVKYINQNLDPYKAKVLLGHINARSLPNSIDEIRYILFRTSFDVFGVSETWLIPGTPKDRVNIDGYKIFRQDRTHKRGGGVALYVKNTYKTKVLKTPMDILVPENIWVEIEIDKRKIVVGVLYKAPNIPYTIFSQCIEAFIKIYSNYDHVVLLGDTNIDMLDMDCASTKFFIENFIEPLSLKQVITKPTRITKTSKTLIDHAIVTNSKNVLVADCADPGGISDHHLIFLAYSLKKPKFKPYTVTTRNFKRINWDAFYQDLEELPWENIFNNSDVNSKVTIFETYTNELLDKHAPFRTFRVTKTDPTPWIDDDLKTLMNFRDVKKSSFNESGVEKLFDEYKEVRNQVTKLRRRAFAKHVQKNLNSKIKESKDFYKAARSLHIIQNKKARNPINFSATKLNEAFTENNNRPPDETGIDAQIRSLYEKNPPTLHKFNFTEVHEDEVVKIVKSLKSTSFGIDKINSYILKLIINRIGAVVTDLVNSSFKTRVFPSRWKVAIITPIPKVDYPSKEKDFRPISLLCTISKVLEKIANKQILAYLIKHALLDTCQSAYKPHHGCITALIKVVDDILDGIDDSEATLLVLLDFSKAFDTVNHRLLLEKLSILGFQDTALQWVESYLSDRKQQVKTESGVSDFINLKNGVPQGSILGPLLFTIMVLDIRQHINFASHHSYADDLQLYKSFKPAFVNDTIISMNKDLEKVSEYCHNSALKINEEKCYFMIVGSSKSLSKMPHMPHVDIMINNIPIERVYSIRNLGITFDEVLSWRRQVARSIQKAMGNFITISRFKKFLTRESKIILVESVILSMFNFGDVLQLNVSQNLQNKIQKVQNLCLRLIFNVKKKTVVDYDELRRELNMLDMNQRRILHSLCLLFKILNDTGPVYLRDLFTLHEEVHVRETRTSNRNIYLPNTPISSIHNRSFKYYAARIWNELPNDVQSSKTVDTFKRKVKKMLLSKELIPPAP